MEHIERRLRHRFKIMMINEILSGQTKSYIERTCGDMQIPLDFDLHGGFLCITGTDRRLYERWYNTGVQVGSEIFISFCDAVPGLLHKAGYRGEAAAALYFHSRKVCILFSPEGQPKITPYEMAERLHNDLECRYQARIHPHYQNFTVLGGQFHTFEDIAALFQTAFTLSGLSWFTPYAKVVTPEGVLAATRRYTFEKGCSCIQDIQRCLSSKQVERAFSYLEDLFLERLRFSLDIPLTKKLMQNLQEVYLRYSILLDKQVDLNESGVLFQMEEYRDIEDCARGIRMIFAQLAQRLAQEGCPSNYLVEEACTFIRSHYDQPITAADVAAHIGIVPGYLSRLFNKEMQESIPAYLRKKRMGKARQLLRESELPIGDIPERVGITSYESFARIFKNDMGITPTEYRNEQR